MKYLIFYLLVAPSIVSGQMKSGIPNSHPSSYLFYGPEFWRRELKLRASQLVALDEINSDFYQSVLFGRQLPAGDRTSALEAIVRTRQQRIMVMLHRRQEKKWERLMEGIARPSIESNIEGSSGS